RPVSGRDFATLPGKLFLDLAREDRPERDPAGPREVQPEILPRQRLRDAAGAQVEAPVGFLPLALDQFGRQLTHFVASLAVEEDVILPILDKLAALALHDLLYLGAWVGRHHREVRDHRVYLNREVDGSIDRLLLIAG